MTSKFIRDIKNIFSGKVDAEGMSGWKRSLAWFIKMIDTTVDTFAEHRMGFQCVALAYFVTLAIIPLSALIFYVTDGLGVYDSIEPLLYKIVPNNPDIIKVILDKAKVIIDTAKSGPVGLVSALTFLWTILWLMFQTERVFNNIWGIRKIPRPLVQRFGSYFLILLGIPMIVILFASGFAFLSNATTLVGFDFIKARSFIKLLAWLALVIFAIVVLSVMYWRIPATKVRYKNTLIAAAVAGVIFVLFQYLYLQTQIFVIRLNTVYGAIAAIPLFLIWLNYSWQIIMYGAQFSCCLQQEQEKENE
ncbi:MAG: YihY/virulence factor BrkB family protein [Bacteroidales bacterium]|nr:YihY/virulence factor BrkB family protein [Bacteroidales bacterium]